MSYTAKLMQCTYSVFMLLISLILLKVEPTLMSSFCPLICNVSLQKRYNSTSSGRVRI